MEKTIYQGSVTSVPLSLFEDGGTSAREALTVLDRRSEKASTSLGRNLTKYEMAYAEDDEYLHVPRGWDLPKAVAAKGDVEFVKFSKPGTMSSSCEFGASLSALQNQPAAFSAINDRLDLKGDALCCMSPGRGKTVVAIAVACSRKVRTAIVVDRDFLMDQWEERIRRFTRGAGKIGVVKGSKREIGKNFTIISLKTLIKHPECIHPEEFGLVVFDECHIMSAPTFHRVITMFPHERLGLTATPERADGLENLFQWHLGGDPCFRDTSNNAPALWYFKRLPELLSETEARKLKLYKKIPGSRHERLERSRFESIVAESTTWTAIIAADLFRMYQAGRQVILLGSRVEQLKEIQRVLYAEYQVRSGLAVGSVKGRERAAAFECQIVLATSSLASRALDIDCLDTLVLLFPTSDETFIRQAKGRTDRSENRSVVFTYSHNYNQKLLKREKDMMELVRQVDSSPTFKLV